MTDSEFEDVDIDGFLESDESIEDLMKEEFSGSDLVGKSEAIEGALSPDIDVRELDEDEYISHDERLIKGTGIAFADISDDVDLENEFTEEEEMVALHKDNDVFEDAALNAVYKSTMNERAANVRSQLDKRELLDLAADIVDEYFRKHVKTEGIDDSRLNKLKFAARKRVLRNLKE